MILDRDLKGQVLIEKIEELLSNEDRLKEMAQNSKSLGKAEATENIVSLIQDLLKKE